MDESHQQLLQTLKSVVEGLLNCQVANVWNIYGGLSRLHNVLEKILKHEFIIFKQNGEEDCWIFIQGLNWLQPSLATSPTPVSPNSPPPHPHTDKAMIWLHNSLETHSLSEKLAWLVSDEQHLASCYSPRAFLRHPKYVEAALVCLRAIEQNQLPLLAEIHPCLYLSARSLKAQEKFHRRCSSFPESFQRTMFSSKSTDLRKMTEMTDLKNQVQNSTKVLESEIAEEQNKSTISKTKIFYKIKPWRSLPDVANLQFVIDVPKETVESALRKSKTEPSSPAKHNLRKLTPSMLKVDYMGVLKENNFSIKANRSGKLKMSDVNMSSVDSIDSVIMKRRKKKSFIEDGGGNSIEPMTRGSSFPKPEEGQSLINFLSSELFTELNAELDRETSHFRICEAVISAIEQVKCNNWEKMMEEKSKQMHYSRKKSNEEDRKSVLDKNKESDEEKDLKQRIRLRKRLKEDKIFPSFSDTTNTDQSFSPRSSDSASSIDSVSTDVEDHEVDKVTNLSEINNSGLSLSLASLYSEADLVGRSQKSIPSSSPRDTSVSLGKSPSSFSSFTILDMPKEKRNTAELVGLSLLSKFDDQQLPKASEIQWVLSDLDVPEQKLLPLPHNFHVEESFENLIALRGTETWAPPRAQLVLTCQNPPKRSAQITKQDFRCAGCGMKVAPEYSHRFRYCEYLTKYFCTGCHKNKLMLIPGRIVFKWDFKKYPVSDFSFNVLEHMMHDPLFNVNDLNPELYKRVKNLEKLRKLRMQLPELKNFLEHCKYYSQEMEEINKLSSHLLTDCDTYSIIDFIQVKTGELLRKVNQIVTQATNHVGNCLLCRGRGFMCEMCSLKDIIYPWQIGKVIRCSKCGSCHHTSCLTSNVSCPRCIRLKSRGRQVS